MNGTTLLKISFLGLRMSSSERLSRGLAMTAKQSATVALLIKMHSSKLDNKRSGNRAEFVVIDNWKEWN
jgi:hypothetical protein